MFVFYALIFIISLFLLYRGATYVVDYSSRFASQLGVTPIVIALTIVALGTSAPELVASIAAALENKPDLIMGNNIGSNIANIGMVLAIGAMIRTIKVHSKTLKREIPFFIAAALFTLLFSLDGVISRFEGLLFIFGTIVFISFLLYMAKRERVFDEAVAQVKARIEHHHPALQIFMILFGLALLIIGAKLLVDSATALAVAFGVSQAVIGITIMGIGTSLPELVTAVIASFKHNNEIVIGNVIGSNILNLFFILGVTAMLVPIQVNLEIIKFDIPIMLLFSLVVVTIMRTRFKVTRLEGLFLLVAYAAYITYVVVR